ncbi:MAG: hypothetical protein JNJ88_12170 [Planctomycetes bacterium]|nr:hypothetical protein [Planctomycetota bacterium]
MPPRVNIQDTLKTPPSTMRASFDPRPIQGKSEDELLPQVAPKVPAGSPGSELADPVAKARAYVDSFGEALKARLAPEREAISKLNFEQQVHFLGRVLGLEMKAAATQWVALIYVKRGLDSYC